MIIKLLNGELLPIDTHKDDNIESIKNRIANALGLYWSQVEVIEFKNDNQDEDEKIYDLCAIISDQPTIQFTNDQTQKLNHVKYNKQWKHYINEDILKRHLQLNNLNILSNPHPIIVNHALQLLFNRNKENKREEIYSNPSDVIVDFILERLDQWMTFSFNWSKLSENSNPRLIQRLIKDFPGLIKRNSFSLLDNNEAVEFVWNCDNDRYDRYEYDLTISSILDNRESSKAAEFQIEYSKRNQQFKYKLLDMAQESKHHQLIEWVLKELDIPNKLLSNPHPIAVKWTLDHLPLVIKESNDKKIGLNYLSQNSNQDVVEWLFNHSTYIQFPYFFANSNEMAISYIKEKINREEIKYDKNNWKYILKNSNPDMFLFAWHKWHMFEEDICTHIHDVEKILGTTNVNIKYNQ